MYLKVIVLMLVVVSLAAADSPWKTTGMAAEITFSGEANIVRESADASISWVEGRFYLVPLDSNVQSPELLGHMPDDYRFEEDESGNRFVVFRWENPVADSLPYAIVWRVVVNSFGYKIGSLGTLGEYADDIKKYLEAGGLTFWSGYMKAKAESLVQGSESVLESARRLGNWVSSSLTYDRAYWEVTAPAQEVFCHRRGVCDEFTNLFIAMARSVGIPTRYAEGLVYSGEEWNYHAWAEVYSDGQWLPVDPTYNEAGFLDSTHIALAKVMSDEDVYNRIKWAGVASKASFGEDEKFIEMETESLDLLEISLTVPEKVVGSMIFEVDAKLTNTLDSYVVATCAINMPLEIVLVDEKEKSLILGPKGEGRLSWEVASPGNLDKRWLHKMPIQIHCFPNGFANKSVTIDPRYSEDPVWRVMIVDLAVLNSSSSLVRVRNDGTDEVSKLTIKLCLENGEERCESKVVEGFEPGGIADVFFEVDAKEGDRITATVESDELAAVSAETVLTGLEEATRGLEKPEVLLVLKPPKREADDWVVIMMAILILSAILSAVAASVIRKH